MKQLVMVIFMLALFCLHVVAGRMVLVQPDEPTEDGGKVTNPLLLRPALNILKNIRDRLRSSVGAVNEDVRLPELYDREQRAFAKGAYNPEYYQGGDREFDDPVIVNEVDLVNGADADQNEEGEWEQEGASTDSEITPSEIDLFDEDDPDDNYEPDDPDDEYEANEEIANQEQANQNGKDDISVPSYLMENNDVHYTEKRPSNARESKKDAAVEVLVFVDYSIFRFYLRENDNNKHRAMAAIKKYYGTVFAMANQIYENIIDPYLTLRLTISGMLISESRSDSPWIEYLVKWGKDRKGQIHASKSLAKFTKWLRKMYKKLPKHDHAMSFTRYRLVNGRDSEVEGMAQKKAICKIKDGASRSIVHERGDYNCFGVIAHEIGHSLGAGHDGHSPNKDCPYKDMFVMAPQHSSTTDQPENMLRFSRCSIRQMRDVIVSPQGKCLLDDPIDLFKVNLEKNLPGREVSLDKQCTLSFGDGAALCPMAMLQAKMCQAMWCQSPPSPGRRVSCTTRSRLAALPGSPCNTDGQICYRGQCVDDPDKWKNVGSSNKYSQIKSRYQGKYTKSKGPYRINNCKGDKNPRNCKKLMKVNPGACSRANVRRYCCHTCFNS